MGICSSLFLWNNPTHRITKYLNHHTWGLGWFKTPVSSQTQKLMAATKFSDYLGLNHYKKAKKLKHFIHLGLGQGPQSFATYRSISPSGNLGNQLKNHVLVM